MWPAKIAKPRHEWRGGERREVVHRWPQARRAERDERHIADRQKHGEAKLSQFFDKRRQGESLSGACRMQQGEPPIRPCEVGPPPPLVAPRKIVAAELSPPIKI